MPTIDLPVFEQVNWHVPLNAALTQLNAFVDELANEVELLSGGGGGAVDSVNGATGVVVLTVDDISDTASTTKKFLTPAERTKLTNLSGTNTGDQTSVTGNAGTATRLQTPRTINGVAFDGSANITVADATKEPALGTSTALTYLRGDRVWGDLYEVIRDVVGGTLVAGTGMTVTVNDAADTITLASSGGGASYGTGKVLVAQDFTTAGTARCTADTTVSVRWRGPVQPTNMLTGDEWYVTS